MRNALYGAIAALVTIQAAPAQAERLLVDHNAYPPLARALEHQDDNVYFVRSEKPHFILDRIKVQGESMDNWREAIELVVYPRKRSLTAPLAWLDQFRAGEDKTCPSTWAVLESGANSVTFSRTGAQCPQLAGQTRIYRAVLGRKEVFTVAGLYRGEIGDEMRRQWLALLATARLDN